MALRGYLDWAVAMADRWEWDHDSGNNDAAASVAGVPSLRRAPSEDEIMEKELLALRPSGAAVFLEDARPSEQLRSGDGGDTDDDAGDGEHREHKEHEQEQEQEEADEGVFEHDEIDAETRARFRSMLRRHWVSHTLDFQKPLSSALARWIGCGLGAAAVSVIRGERDAEGEEPVQKATRKPVHELAERVC